MFLSLCKPRKAENKGLKIIDMHFYCLIETFKYLDYKDLLNLKAAHNGFGEAIEYAVSKGNFCLRIDWYDDDEENSEKEMMKIDRFLMQFGHKLKRLHIALDEQSIDRCKSMSRHYQRLINSFCSNGNVKHCSFLNIDMSEKFLCHNWPFFNSLDGLTIKFSFYHESEFKASDLI